MYTEDQKNCEIAKDLKKRVDHLLCVLEEEAYEISTFLDATDEDAQDRVFLMIHDKIVTAVETALEETSEM